jgi:hypothetical protein
VTVPAAQRFFETPLITAVLATPDTDAVAKAAVALAGRYTIDVSQPAAPRFAWSVAAREVILMPGEAQPLAIAPGAFWVAACCIDPGDGEGGLSIEDPRLATSAAGVPGLGVSADPAVETIAPHAGELTLFQGFLRHALTNPGTVRQRWVLAELRAKPENFGKKPD